MFPKETPGRHRTGGRYRTTDDEWTESVNYRGNYSEWPHSQKDPMKRSTDRQRHRSPHVRTHDDRRFDAFNNYSGHTKHWGSQEKNGRGLFAEHGTKYRKQGPDFDGSKGRCQSREASKGVISKGQQIPARDNCSHKAADLRYRSPGRSSSTEQLRCRSTLCSRDERENHGTQYEVIPRPTRDAANLAEKYSTSQTTDRKQKHPSPSYKIQRCMSSASFQRASGYNQHVDTELRPAVVATPSSSVSKDRQTKQAVTEQHRQGGNRYRQTEATNNTKGYSEPPDARKPNRRWSLYPAKERQALPTLYIHRQSSYIIGRCRQTCDLPIDHPSCSKQHAVLQYRLVPNKRRDCQCIRPYILDLESANGTFINFNQIEPLRFVELFEKDVLSFGYSSRTYVLLDQDSKPNP